MKHQFTKHSPTQKCLMTLYVNLWRLLHQQIKGCVVESKYSGENNESKWRLYFHRIQTVFLKKTVFFHSTVFLIYVYPYFNNFIQFSQFIYLLWYWSILDCIDLISSKSVDLTNWFSIIHLRIKWSMTDNFIPIISIKSYITTNNLSWWVSSESL